MRLGEKCGNCLYRDEGGRCRRYPPQAYTEFASPNAHQATFSTWYQPYVDADEWCGEYRMET